jgi:hypothetical protein
MKNDKLFFRKKKYVIKNCQKENAHFICNSKDHSNGDILISIDASIIKKISTNIISRLFIKEIIYNESLFVPVSVFPTMSVNF